MSTHTVTREVDAATAARSVLCQLAVLFPDKGAEVTRVIVEQTGDTDAQWNIELGGTDLFGSEQQVAAADTPELFRPEQNRYTSSATDQIAVDVSSAAGTASDQLIVTVVYEVQ